MKRLAAIFSARLRRSAIVLVLVGLYIALFVAPLFLRQYALLAGTPDRYGQETLDALSTFVEIFCLVFALSITRMVWLILWPLLLIFSAIADYMIVTFQAQISKDSIAAFFEVTSREVNNFLSLELLANLLYAALLAIAGIILVARERPEPNNRRAAAVALILSLAIVLGNEGSMATPYPPYNFLTAAWQYAYERISVASAGRRDISQDAHYVAGDEPLTIVIVIGESARSDHFSINGYGRETSPLMEKRHNLINFRDTTSCGVFTRVSLPCILTRATAKNKAPSYRETSLISVFKRLGFATSWFGAQGKFATADPTTAISGEAATRVLLEEREFLDNQVRDEQLLPLLDQALKNSLAPSLIVLHMYGSHWQYSARYPTSFERFTPTCIMTLSRERAVEKQVDEIKACGKNLDALVNSYDNSILYTDYFLDQVITRLEKKNALFVFTSDHGESLGEGGRFLHGHDNAPENYRVPMFWWASDKFIGQHRAQWDELMHKSNFSASHDVIFHSILDCAGVSSPVIEKSLSLCHGGKNDGRRR